MNEVIKTVEISKFDAEPVAQGKDKMYRISFNVTTGTPAQKWVIGEMKVAFTKEETQFFIENFVNDFTVTFKSKYIPVLQRTETESLK